MLKGKIVSLMNEQITKELESAYLYLGFANYFKEKGLNGFAHWYCVQADEEVDHARRFIDYLHDNCETVVLKEIEVLDTDFEDDMCVLTKGLKHEMYVTSLINNIYKEALDTEDYRTMFFLDWFIDEQLEEEKNAQDLIDMYNNFVCDCGCSLFEIDQELAKREAQEVLISKGGK